MQQIRAKVKPIVVPVYELPEYICVETNCIGPKDTQLLSTKGIEKISKRLAKMIEHGKIVTKNMDSSTQTARPANVEQGTMTSNFPKTMPKRGREQQTERRATADVGIQCQRDSSDEWLEAEPSISNDTEGPENDCLFLSYMSQHTSMFPNGMLECCICGEVAISPKEQYLHMSLHYGPSALCSNCGQLVAHENLLLTHNYSCPARINARRRPQIHMQCPHLHCSLMITSKRQLRQHLRKHLNVNAYHCLQCRKSFSSSTQFLVHRQLQSAGSGANYIYLAKPAAQSAGKSRIHRCSICLKRFSTASRCVQHRRRCILQHHKRLLKLLMPV